MDALELAVRSTTSAVGSTVASGTAASHLESGAPVAPHWPRELAEAVRTVERLVERLSLDPLAAEAPSLLEGRLAMPVLVPESYLRRMQVGDWSDPLLRQVLPLADEAALDAEVPLDAVGDQAARVAPGLLHKYQGRALLVATGACAIHCRYCFRKHYPYDQEPKSLREWQPALEAIAADPSIHEIILSGGDPLVLTDDRLEQLIDALETIPTLKRLRIHTRLPIVLPARVTDRLLSVLASTRLQTWIVLHANHSNELVADCAEAIMRLRSAGLPLLNQAVLLRSVNDSLDALAALCERLIDLGVAPYYLHQLDRVRGVEHFEVSVEQGLALVAQLAQRLPGYAVPRYVRELPGEPSKTPILG